MSLDEPQPILSDMPELEEGEEDEEPEPVQPCSFRKMTTVSQKSHRMDSLTRGFNERLAILREDLTLNETSVELARQVIIDKLNYLYKELPFISANDDGTLAATWQNGVYTEFQNQDSIIVFSPKIRSTTGELGLVMRVVNLEGLAELLPKILD